MNWKIKKSILEWSGITLVMLISFLSPTLLYVSLILSLILLFQREVGAIKIINLIALRTIVNPGLGIDISNAQNLKWLILIGCSTYLVLSFRKLEKSQRNKISKIMFWLICFVVINIFVALFFSSLPTVALFKLFSYVIVFTGTLIGIGSTYKKFDWTKWLFKIFQLIMVLSLLSIAMPYSYLRNGVSFQGITNQPNMFGILSVLFLALLFAYSRFKNYSIYYLIFFTSITFVLVYLCRSRTAFLSCLLLLIIYTFFKVVKLNYLRLATFSFIAVILIIFNNTLYKNFMVFLYKEQENDIFYSRSIQLKNLLDNFYNSPIFGNGFSVPVLPIKSYSFSYDFIVEPGNLFLSVLSYSGIVGFLVFLFFLLRVFLSNIKNLNKNLYLFLAPILISMGEMVFFSSNNIGVWCYMFFALFIFIEKENINEIKATNNSM